MRFVSTSLIITLAVVNTLVTVAIYWMAVELVRRQLSDPRAKAEMRIRHAEKRARELHRGARLPIGGELVLGNAIDDYRAYWTGDAPRLEQHRFDVADEVPTSDARVLDHPRTRAMVEVLVRGARREYAAPEPTLVPGAIHSFKRAQVSLATARLYRDRGELGDAWRVAASLVRYGEDAVGASVLELRMSSVIAEGASELLEQLWAESVSDEVRATWRTDVDILIAGRGTMRSMVMATMAGEAWAVALMREPDAEPFRRALLAFGDNVDGYSSDAALVRGCKLELLSFPECELLDRSIQSWRATGAHLEAIRSVAQSG